MTEPFAPSGWEPPPPLRTASFRLAPLGPEHHDSDFLAWGSSIEHIRATPGFRPGGREDPWPYPMAPEENVADLERHHREFVAREAFAYTVLAPDADEVIGCVYMYPDRTGSAAAEVRCWVTASRAELDGELAEAVRDWIAAEFPWTSVRYPGRFGHPD